MEMENVRFGIEMTEQEMEVDNFMEEHAFLFNDMLFKPDSKTYEMAVMSDGQTEDAEMFLPECLLYFGYECFHLKVCEMDDCNGFYNHETQTLAIDSKHVTPDTILHEMIHLHEDVLLELSPYYRDVVFYELYKTVKERIPLLDEIIEQHGHLSVMTRVFGGLHSMLFLLKSFEIDMYHSWKLGTTFGYGQADVYGEYEYRR